LWRTGEEVLTATLDFFVSGTPRPGGSKKGFAVKDKKTGKYRAILVEDSVNKDWKCSVREAATKALGELSPEQRKLWPTRGACELTIAFYLKRAGNHYGTKNGERYLKNNAPKYHISAPDRTKLLRSTEDALGDCGLIVDNDSRFCDGRILKLYTDTGATGARIRIRQLENTRTAKG